MNAFIQNKNVSLADLVKNLTSNLGEEFIYGYIDKLLTDFATLLLICIDLLDAARSFILKSLF